MKQTIKYALLIALFSCKAVLSAACLDSCDCENVSKSHLAVRPHFQSASPEMLSAFRYDRMLGKDDGRHAALQVAAYGSRSTNESELARYFMPFCKTELVVAELDAAINQVGDFNEMVQLLNADVLADYFNVLTNDQDFHSIISFCPKQSVFGFAIHGRKSFWRNDENEGGYWASISIPIERVKNNMNLTERVISDGGGPNPQEDLETVYPNMTAAFDQKEWNHSRIPCGDLTASGVADIELKFGYESTIEEPYHLETYFGFLLPTGKQGDSRYMWAPQIGHGRHFGLMFGGGFSKEIWHSQESDAHVRMHIDTHTQYLFGKNHCRTFDLKCKPWSRFMKYYADREQAVFASYILDLEPNQLTNILDENIGTPGVNLLTMNANVIPGFSHNTTSAFVYTSDNFQAEFGYNLYCRQDECVQLASRFAGQPAIKDNGGDGDANPIQDITASIFVHANELEINFTGSDGIHASFDETALDLQSAAAAGGISHTLYGSFGWRWDDRDYPLFVNFGGSCEKGKGSNGLVDRWTVWAKAGWSL